MSTTLPHGIIQINEGNISWYGDITANWQLIDSKIGGYDAAIASIPAPANDGRLTINYGGTTIAMFGADNAGNVTADIPAPGDGALTVTQGGSTLGTFSANQAAPETIDIPAPGDGTLTIQLNGSDVQTFTANASTNATANIQCVDLANNQTVGGNKEFTGTTTAHDVVPSATDTYNFGSSTAQWNNAYIKSLTINGVAAGDILTHNASEFVGVSGNQTISGDKSFKGIIIRNVGNFTAGEAPAAQTTCYVLKHTNNDGTHTASSINSYMFTTGESMCELVQTPCIGSAARTWFRTNTDGTYNIYSYTKNGSLGTPGYRWKDVNTVLLNGKTPAYSTDIPTKVSQLTNDSGFITSENALPVGSYIQFAGSQAPAGFLVCNGGEISRTTYSELFDVIGTTYGSGDGSTTFNLPDLTDRFLQGSTTSGTVKNAGLPNITGAMHYGAQMCAVQSVDGAFSAENTAQYMPAQSTANPQGLNGIGFDASRSNSIYGNSNTVQPPALTCLICIKY